MESRTSVLMDFGDSERMRAEGGLAALLTQKRRSPQSSTPSVASDRHGPEASLGNEHRILVLGLLSRNYLLCFTSCVTGTRPVTEFVAREVPRSPRLTRSVQAEAPAPGSRSLREADPKAASGLTACHFAPLAVGGPEPVGGRGVAADELKLNCVEFA